MEQTQDSAAAHDANYAPDAHDAHMSAAPASSSEQPADPSLPSAAAYAAAQADLQATDAILEPTILASLSTYLAGSGGGAKPAKRAVRMLSESYRGRGDMISLLSQWSCAAGVATPATIEHDLLSTIQRTIIMKFEGGTADRVLEQAQPAWLEGLVSNQQWEAPLLRLAEKAPGSLFIKLCISLMGEQRREQELGGGGKADGTSGGAAAAPTSVLNASLRAAALHDFEKFNALLSALLEGIIEKTVERAAARKRRRAAGGEADGVKMEDEPAAAAVASSAASSAAADELTVRIRLLEVDSLVQDFLRLSAQSEWSYLYAQRALQAAMVNAPRSAAFILQRLSQDLSHQATFPPPPPASLLTAKIAPEAPSKNLSVYPFDLLLKGIKDEQSDLSQVWNVLARTEQLSLIDINKLYARYAPTAQGVEPPPVVLLRNKQLIRTLLTSLFAPNSALMTADGSASSSSSSSNHRGPVSDRHKYAYLLTYACCVVDDRVCTVQLQRNTSSEAESAAASDAASSAAAAAVSLSRSNSSSASAIDKASFDATLTALLRFHDLASNKGWGLRPYTLLRCIHAHLSLPLFACAAVYWIQTQLCDLSFYDMTYHSTVTPYFLSLLGELSSKHPLLRRQVFDTLTRTFHLSPPSLDGFAGIQFKKSLLNLMLHLVHCGFNFGAVVAMLLKEIPRGLDHSLIRHFSVQLLFTTGPPYSRTFLEHTLQLLAMPQTFKALQNTMQAGLQVSRLLAPDAATTTNSAAVQLLAQAHVAANTPAARRLLATAGMQDLIPDVVKDESKTSDAATAATAPDAAVKSEPEEPSAKKSKHATPPPTEGSAAAATAPNSGADSASVASSSAPPGSKAARREEKDRARRAAAEMEQRRKADTIKRLLVNTPRAPRPMAQITHDSHDGSERAVLDFCTLLHADPELLRCSRVVPGLLLNDEGVVVADECDTATAATDTSQPIDETRMQQYMQTIQQYVSMQESRS